MAAIAALRPGNSVSTTRQLNEAVSEKALPTLSRVGTDTLNALQDLGEVDARILHRGRASLRIRRRNNQ